MQKLTMKQLPKEDRPYEKCLESGATSLTDAELLAVIIRTGSREETGVSLALQFQIRLESSPMHISWAPFTFPTPLMRQ